MEYAYKILGREAAMRLFLPLHQDDGTEEVWRRASGSMKCALCGAEYRYHPYYEENNFHGHPTDHRLCNGDVVHL